MRHWSIALLFLASLTSGNIFTGCDCGNTRKCSLNSDCSYGQYCRNGSCKTDCRQNRDCGPGGRCDVANGRCIETGDSDAWPDAGYCSNDQDCSPPYAICTSGQCTAGCVIEGVTCPFGQVCDRATGHCKPAGDMDLVPCTTDADCSPPDSICDKRLGYCTPGCLTTGCDTGFTCDKATGWCRLPGDEYEPDAFALSYVYPKTGPAEGGNQVWITGAGFTAGTTVLFGGVEAAIASRKLPGMISVYVPAGTFGSVVDIEAKDANTSSKATMYKAYTYTTDIHPAKFDFEKHSIELDEVCGPIDSADLNFDGYPDIVVGCPQSGSLAVSLGGKGLEFAPPVKWAIEYTYPWAIALSDINKDGYVDIVCANGVQTRYLTTALGDGSGAFSYKEELNTGIGPVDVIATDLNRDGLTDIASCDQRSSSLSVFARNSDGKFLDAQPGYIARSPFRLVAFGDQGKMRIASIGSSGTTLSVGDPATVLAEIELQDAPGDLAAADVDMDGFMDMIVSYPGRSSIQVISGLGNRLWAPTREYLAGPGARFIRTADLDGDGDTDIIVAGEGLYILEGNGKAKFSLAMSIKLDSPPSRPIVDDFDRDGLLDIAVRAGKEILVFKNISTKGQESDAPTLLDISPLSGPGAGGNKVSLFGAGFPNEMEVFFGDQPASGLEIRSSGWARITAPPGPGDSGRGVVDVSVKSPGGKDESTLKKAYTYLDEITPGSIDFNVATVSFDGGLNALASADLDGDGLSDVLAGTRGNNGVAPFLAGGLLPGEKISLDGPVRAIATGDLDGDSCPDAATTIFSQGKVQVEILHNDCTGKLIDAGPVSEPGVSMSAGLILVDLDRDASLDIAGAGGNSATTLLGAGNGYFGVPNKADLVSLAQDIDWGFFGFDGLPDLALADSSLDASSGKLVIAAGAGNGKLGLGATVATDSPVRRLSLGHTGDLEFPIPFIATDSGVYAVTGNPFTGQDVKQVKIAGTAMSELVSTDLNGDGWPDLAALDASSNSVIIFIGDPAASTWSRSKTIAINGVDPSGSRIISTDLNSDQAMDLVVSTTTGMTLLLNKPD
ncbi:MAG: hypothetical protein GXP49_04440 [Deltaproteobacteria bacterium]|nr:hypothetical protein [Deltaproteobacteria bacterium]